LGKNILSLQLTTLVNGAIMMPIKAAGEVTMYSKFEALDGEKQQRILNAAMKEFASKGYDHASTNRIVEDAGIAKGLLFHYFKSKKQLFLYLYDRGIAYVTEEVFRGVDLSERDFFRRIQQAQQVKIALIRVYPDIMNFLKAAYLEESEAVVKELGERNSGLVFINFQRAFEGVDTSAFREDLDKNLLMKTITWAYEGFANANMELIRSMDTVDYGPMLALADEYTAFLKKCFYQQGKKD
jgi:TetR/AcrR family transcriptional regulator